MYVDLAAAGIHPRLHGARLHMEYDMARGGQRELRIVFDSAEDPRQPFAIQRVEPLALPLVGSIDASPFGFLNADSLEPYWIGVRKP